MTPSAPDTASAWEEARRLARALHLPGARDRHRQCLETALLRAATELETVRDDTATVRLRRILVEANAAAAEDARYGAGQLSRGAQRAPTVEDCADGWSKVVKITRRAMNCARDAELHATALAEARHLQLAHQAQQAADEAVRTVAQRNRAYTFQTHPELSFGEGWYLAAAAVLCGVQIQIQPDSQKQAQARRFVKDAGLAHLLVPYRPRPASPKQLTALIAQAFHDDPARSQKAVRRAFLGQTNPTHRLTQWLEQRVAPTTSKTVLLWVRRSSHDCHRNTDLAELATISGLVRTAGLMPVYFGDALADDQARAPGIDLTLCWKDDIFQGLDMRRKQLQLFELLRSRHGLVGQVGVTSAGMDGPALLGLPTSYLTRQPNVRLGRWVGAVPDYQEIVRNSGYLDALERTLREWSR